MITRDHHKHTEFLKHCLRYGEDDGCQELRREITRLQREAHCVRRAAWLMAVLILLTVTGFAYATILLGHFPYSMPQFAWSLICALGVGSLISLVAFIALGMVYRVTRELRRGECRQMVARLLESRLGNPPAMPQAEPPVSNESPGPVQVPAEGNGSPGGMESTAQG